MRKYLTIALMFIAISRLHAQKIEVSVQANSGLFHYSGNGTAPASFITQGQTAGQDYTNNPYGSKNGFSYGAGIQAQHVSKSGFITGLEGGYEILRSKVDITGYYPFVVYFFYTPAGIYAPAPQIPAHGNSFLTDRSININPYIGYRLKANKISVDVLPGIDIGFNTSSYDKGKATQTNPPSGQTPQTYQTNIKRPDAPTDIRLRFGIAANYKKIAITGSYAQGLTNYDKNMQGSNLNVHSELFRFGIAYKITGH